MKYVCLTRVSSQGQMDGYSPEYQSNQFKKYVGEKPYVFFEEVEKGWRPVDKRNVLLDAIDCLENGDVLLVTHPDRLSRGDADERAYIKYLVRKKGARIEYTDAPNGETMEEKVMEMVTGIVSYIETHNIRRRVISAHQTAKIQKKRLGFVKYGYRDEDGKLVMDDQEQENIKYLKALRRKGYSLRKIVALASNVGVVNRKGKAFDLGSLRRILSRLDNAEQESVNH